VQVTRADPREPRLEVRLLPLLSPGARAPQGKQLSQILEALEHAAFHTMLIAQLTGTAEELPHPERLHLCDTQGVAGLEQPPGRRGRIGLNTPVLSENGCRTE